MVCITLPDGSRREFEQPVSVHDVAASIGKSLGRSALGARLAAPAPGETTPPAGEPAAEGAIGRTDEPARAGGASVATPPGEEGEAAAAARPAAGKAPERDEPAPAGIQAAAAADDDHVAGDMGTGSPPSGRDAVTPSDGDRKRTMAHSEPRRSDTGHAEPKSRRRSSEVRGARAVGPANNGPADTAQPSRTHVAQPSRAPEIDPDGTLPLGAARCASCIPGIARYWRSCANTAARRSCASPTCRALHRRWRSICPNTPAVYRWS